MMLHLDLQYMQVLLQSAQGVVPSQFFISVRSQTPITANIIMMTPPSSTGRSLPQKKKEAKKRMLSDPTHIVALLSDRISRYPVSSIVYYPFYFQRRSIKTHETTTLGQVFDKKS